MVLNRDGTPLSGVKISILAHPEFGSTMSRADGMFDMAVNGGGLLTVDCEKAGYLGSQRQVNTPWQDYVWLPDVMMIQADTQVTSIDLSSSASVQMARGSVVNDSDGTRQATLLFPQDVKANMTLPDGTTQTLTTMHVRATEYTVGANGSKAMPAELPPTSGYTYAVELSVDEAAGAADVSFNRPLYFYVENFLNFSVGSIVPVGYYNRSLGLWIASNNGLVIKIISITNGMADLDVNGSSLPANASQLAALNITDAERQQLTSVYHQGQSLWRVPITHFSPWDCNWPFGPGPGAGGPNGGNPQTDNPPKDPCESEGSIIGCQNQELGEAVNIAGTPFSLHYQSGRVPGHKVDNTLKIPLSNASVPANLKRIDLEISVAGRLFTQNFSNVSNQSYTFTWDGKDAYGRTFPGAQPITVNIGYVYNAVYQTPGQLDQAFAEFGTSLTGNRARQEITIWQKWQGSIGAWDARGQDIGGWSLSVHHAYDPYGRILYLGDGGRRSASAEISSIITTEAGNGFLDYSVDGGPATQTSLGYPNGVAVGGNGSIYIADTGDHRIRRVGTDGIITTVAGNGTYGYSGDGGPAIQAGLSNPFGVAVGQDGSIYIADTGNHRIRRVGTDGIITTVAGNGIQGYSGDGGPATQASLSNPNGVAVGQDGSIYIADSFNHRIRRVGTDGIITTVAGNNYFGGYSGDGGPAIQASLFNPVGVAVGQDGSIYIADSYNERIRRVGTDGIITTVAGDGIDGYSGDDGPATQASLFTPVGVAVGQDGSIYIAEDFRIRRVASALPGFSATDLIISSEDGSEIYIFNSNGRHLRTLDALTGAMRYRFAYDTAGRLINVTDGDGNILTIERDSAGNATAIVSPYGQRTNLTLDANGYLANITNPADESNQFTYTEDGLLTNMTDPRGNLHNFSYDAIGRLIKDEDSVGGIKTLERTDIANGYSVKLATGLNRNTTYQMEQLSTGDQRLMNTLPDGLKIQTTIGTNGSQISNYPDSTQLTLVQGPDPRFGMQVPVPNSMTIKTSGLTETIVEQVNATLADPDNPLSLQTLTKTKSINGRTYTSIFNTTLKNLTTISPLGRTRTTILDNNSRIIQNQIPSIIPINLTYNSHGRLSSMVQGTRNFVFNYDVHGNLVNVTDPLSSTTGYEYDSAVRMTRQTLPDESQIQYAYDANRNVIGVIPPGRPNNAFNYTSVDLRKDYTPPDIGIGDTSTRYTYDIDRQLTLVTRPDGATVNYGYDNAGRLTTISYPEGTISLSYDVTTGNPQSMTAPDGAIVSYGYDGNLQTDVNWSGTISGSFHRTYDNNFSIISEDVNGDVVNFQYDLDGLLTQAGLLNLTNDPQNGFLIGSSLSNITGITNYNSYGEVASYKAAYSGTGMFSINYTRDNVGRITQKNETINGIAHIYNYKYDLVGRLTNVSIDGVQVSQYVYDTNGNRISYMNPSGTINGTYDNQDRLLQYGSMMYNYTKNGELLSKTNGSQTTNYRYDALGNLMNATLPDGTQISYLIDGANRRVGKKVNGVLIQGFLYRDQINPVAEIDNSGNIVSRFVYSRDDNIPDYMSKGGNIYRIIADHLGSPRIVINANTGEIAQQMDYDEFGNVIQDTNPGFQPFGFAGGIYDLYTGLIRFGARDYDTSVGRWTTKDPLDFEGGGPNFYVYATNNPVNSKDSAGLQFDSDSSPSSLKVYIINGRPYCYDPSFMSTLKHKGVCYRELVPEGSPGRHVCYDDLGIYEIHIEDVSPVGGATSSGRCGCNFYYGLIHFNWGKPKYTDENKRPPICPNENSCGNQFSPDK
jgi:RHS repeat-associated protein